jgi:ligand-binding SRPBCC domain-containing protein
MPKIHTTTFIGAPVERVFDLSRHIALYKLIFQSRKEKLTSGAASTLVGKNETITIVAKHAGRARMMMMKITTLQRPVLFIEEQVKGDLQHYKHEHHFKQVQNGTIVIDLLEFGTPKDIMGKVFGKMYFKKYLEELLRKRTELIRSYAETEKWRAVLS